MFTGIIETLGKIRRLNQKELELSCDFSDVEIGDSIAVNGICLTVTKKIKNKNLLNLFFDISPETYSRTNLKYLRIDDFVNLERSLRLGSKIGGHIVTGHVDEVIKILNIIKRGDSFEFVFSISHKNGRLVAEKGSVAIDGISLTVANKFDDSFNIFVVPYTFEKTNLRFKKIGSLVNIEVDVLARYVDSILSAIKDRKEVYKKLFNDFS